MVREAVEQAVKEQSGPVSHSTVRDLVRRKYGEVNANTLAAQLSNCSVNSPSRVHYPESNKPRICTSQYDFLYSTGRGQVVLYDPTIHGQWEIRKNSAGGLEVGQVGVSDGDEDGGDPVVPPGGDQDANRLFALESHLREFLKRNLATMTINRQTLRVYQDDTGREGVEFPTGVGLIDILAVDPSGNFVVFELKVSNGPDRTIGQIARYMAWVRKHLAAGKNVSGVIVASGMDEKLKYAASELPNVTLYEYVLKFELSPTALT
jgi:hypothetical protein